MCHRHVGQIGRNHGFATFREMQEAQGKHNSSKGKNVRNGRETVAHCLHLSKVAVVTELGYHNYSNNIDMPLEMFTSIAVVEQANNRIRLSKLLQQHRRAF